MADANPGKIVKIGGGTAFFEDSFDGHRGLIASGVNYIVYDYLAEVTMSILASTPNSPGYHPGFLRDIKPYLREMLDKGIKIVTNWGGLDPEAAAAAFRELAIEVGRPCKVGVVRGDNLINRVDELKKLGVKEMFSGQPLTAEVSSANAYFGGFPIAAALDAGADVVITGRVVDSALSLGALIHEFGWKPSDYDKLAAGTLIGHLMECSTQVTGGNFTDWMDVPDPANIGSPIAECRSDGSFVLTKPEGTGGLVCPGSVEEQMIYEVSDPQAYFVPDAVCDFSTSRFQQDGPNRVLVTGTTGYAPTDSYKVCATYNEGWRGQVYQPIIGFNAVGKAQRQGQALFDRTNRILRDRNEKPLNQTYCEVIGAESSYGPRSQALGAREVVAMLTVDHDEPVGIEIFLKEQIAAISAMSQGTAMSLGGLVAKGVFPLMRVFNFLLPKAMFEPKVTLDGKDLGFKAVPEAGYVPEATIRPTEPAVPNDIDPDAKVKLIEICYGRSGDKGNLFNVCVFARDPRYYPYIAAGLSADAVGQWFAHLVGDPANPRADRYLLPASRGVNFVVHNSLMGGASVNPRIDPLAKTMAQILMDFEIPVSAAIRDEVAQTNQGKYEYA